MTNTTRPESLDEVLTRYAHASQDFDPETLQDFIKDYPDYAPQLRRCAYIQLTSVAASPAEIAEESVEDADMLHRQSKLLLQMQKLRGTSSSVDEAEASRRLATISGEKNIRSASLSVFGSCEHGEDLLLISIADTTSKVLGVPPWFYNKLGEYLGISREALIAALALKQLPEAGLQRFSAQGKPTELTSISWEELVEDCITDETVKNELLESSKQS